MCDTPVSNSASFRPAIPPVKELLSSSVKLLDATALDSLASELAPVTCDANRSRGAYQHRTTGVEMDRPTRLFVFPGGLLEVADYGDENDGPGCTSSCGVQPIVCYRNGFRVQPSWITASALSNLPTPRRAPRCCDSSKICRDCARLGCRDRATAGGDCWSDRVAGTDSEGPPSGKSADGSNVRTRASPAKLAPVQRIWFFCPCYRAGSSQTDAPGSRRYPGRPNHGRRTSDQQSEFLGGIMRNLVIRSLVILGIGLSAGLPATPSAPRHGNDLGARGTDRDPRTPQGR